MSFAVSWQLLVFCNTFKDKLSTLALALALALALVVVVVSFQGAVLEEEKIWGTTLGIS